MILSVPVSGAIAVALAYLLGSIPFAYIVTRLVSGKDIRKIGTGHTGRGDAGAHNVFVNVGKVAGVAVAILDIAKGIGAIFLARLVMGRPSLDPSELHTEVLFLLASGLAAVAGHIWPAYLKFKGGSGLATCLGVLAVLMPRELLIAMSAAIVLVVITRNALLSVNLSLISLPVWAWFFFRPWWFAIYPLAIMAIMLVHFAPNIYAEWKKAGSLDRLVHGLLRRGRPGRPA